MSLQDRFNATAEKVKTMSPPNQENMLELYSLYKQAVAGDCNIAAPGAMDVKGKAKWNAWNAKKGMSQDDAKEAYIAKATALGV